MNIRHRCDYQCNTSPDKQDKGTKRCKISGKIELIYIKGNYFQYRCHIHKQKKYLSTE